MGAPLAGTSGHSPAFTDPGRGKAGDAGQRSRGNPNAISYAEPEHGAGVADGQAIRASSASATARANSGKVDSGQLIGLISVCLGFFVIHGGALGVALLGALLSSSGGMSGGSGQGGSGHAHSMALHAPLAVVAAGYLLAICLTLAIRQDPAQPDEQPHGTRSAR